MTTLNFDTVKHYFATNTRPYYFISASNFNLIDMHNWVKGWTDINFIDCFDGQAKYTLVPTELSHPVFEELEQINEYLIDHPETLEYIKKDMAQHSQKSGHALFLFFNQALEAKCKALNLQIDLPKNELVQHIDNKITTTELGNEAQVPSVPNALAKVDSYASFG